VVLRLDRLETTGLSPSRVFADMHGRFCIHTDSQSFRVRICQSVYLPDVVEDRVGVRRFFWTLVLATVRSR
jgi:hypothetical protein